MAAAVIVEEHSESGVTGAIELDPFSFHHGGGSRIAGLGGSARPPSNNYVFHTRYVATGTGDVNFIVRFSGLQARKGTLQLLVNMLPDEPGATARVANSYRIALNRLIHQGGATAVRFEGFRGVKFALHGLISDDTDASATALQILLDRPPSVDDSDQAAAARSTAYGHNMARPAAELHSLNSASLTAPFSQCYTRSQLEEAIARSLAKRLGIVDLDPVARWSALFILRALQAYGLAEPGAQGLCLGACPPGLIQELERLGCELTVDRHDGAAPAVGAPPNFDFLCSIGAFGDEQSRSERLASLENSLRSLRPGGLAVHVVSFQPRNVTGSVDSRLDRGDVERLALNLISRGHEVAQLLLDGTGIGGDRLDKESGSAYGIIAKRAPSAL